MPNIPEFDTSAEVTGATLISQTDEEIRQLMTDVKSYQESVSAILNNYTTEEIDSAIANLNADITLKLNELLSVNPDGTYYTKNTIDSKFEEVSDNSLNGLYNAYGFTSPIKKEDLFEETVTANSIVIKASPPIRGFKKIHERNADEVITLPLAPFDISSNDELLDDKINGLICQQTHNKGDIVVTGNELVTNGTFDTDVSGWTTLDSSISVDNNRLKIDVNSNYYGASQNINVIAGVTYSITFTVEAGTTRPRMRIGNTSSGTAYHNTSYGTDGTYTVLVTTTDSSLRLLPSTTASSGTAYFDNISVQLADSIKQAKVDNPSNDLTTSDWQVLDEVSRQDLLYWAEDKTTGAGQWKSVKGLKHYLAKDILNHDLIASDKGWTKIDNNLWEDSTDYITCLSIIPRLNAGAFDFSTNFFGDKEYSDGAYKDSTFRDTSTYNAFVNKGSANGRPDSKDSTRIYSEGENGIIYKESSAKEIHENDLVQEWQRDCVSDLAGINSLNNNAYFTTQGTTLVVEDLTDTAKVLWDLSSKAIGVKQVLYTTDSGATWNTETFTLDYINNQITLGNARADIKVSYVSQNQTLQQQDPIEVIAVGSQAIASNSHSIYKGAMLGISVTDKVQVGNSSNGLESRSVENNNVAISFDHHLSIGESITVLTNERVFLNDDFDDGSYKGEIYQRLGVDIISGTPTNTWDFKSTPSVWEKLGTTISHNPINLDSSESSAFKGLPFVGKASNNELVVGMFTEEGKYSASGYGWNIGVGLTFQQLTNGLVDGIYENDLQTKILYKRTGRFKND